jgi:hypothetical protein
VSIVDQRAVRDNKQSGNLTLDVLFELQKSISNLTTKFDTFEKTVNSKIGQIEEGYN